VGVKGVGASDDAGNADAVPIGFQRSEVGLIPEDWSVRELGALILSAEYSSSAKSNVRGQVPVLRMGNLLDGRIVWDDLVYTSDQREIDKYVRINREPCGNPCLRLS
jgi:hypothetical protein